MLLELTTLSNQIVSFNPSHIMYINVNEEPNPTTNGVIKTTVIALAGMVAGKGTSAVAVKEDYDTVIDKFKTALLMNN